MRLTPLPSSSYVSATSIFGPFASSFYPVCLQRVFDAKLVSRRLKASLRSGDVRLGTLEAMAARVGFHTAIDMVDFPKEVRLL